MNCQDYWMVRVARRLSSEYQHHVLNKRAPIDVEIVECASMVKMR